MPFRLSLWLLGPWHAELDGAPLARLPTRHTRTLLARLALANPRSCARTQLQRDLFPDAPPPLAGAHLRTTLYYLRRCAPIVFYDESAVWLDPELQLVTDVETFVRLAHRQDRTGLGQAVELYEGPFLESALQGWAVDQAETLRRLYVEVLGRLVLSDSGADALSLDAAQRLVREEPWQERWHVILIQMLVARRDRAAARAQWKRARAILRAEGSEPPGAELLALARAIAQLPETAPMRADNRPGTRRLQTPAELDFEQIPLIGRERELYQLEQAWKQAQAGQVVSFILEGAAGVGKSRLVGELAARARLRSNTHVIRLGAHETTRNLEFGVLREGLARDAFDRARTVKSCMALDDVTWGVLTLHLPELASLVPARPVPPFVRLEPAAEQIRYKQALGVWMDRLTEDACVLLILEDSPLADQETLAFLEELPKASRTLMLLMTRRPEMARTGKATLSLAPLSEHDTRAVVHVALGSQIQEEPVKLIAARSGGNPLFVREIIRTLFVQNALASDSRRTVHPPAVRRLAFPNPLADLLAERLKPLSPNARTLAELLAVLARPADQELLTRLLPDVQTRWDAQAELLEQWVLREQQAQLQFDHAWLGETLRASLDENARIAYHRQIAQALEQAPAGEISERMLHLAGAHEWAGAFELAMSVGENALQEGRVEALERALEVADAALEALGWHPWDARGWRRLGLRESFYSLTERDRQWQQALDELEQCARFNRRADWHAQALIRRGRAQREQGLIREAEGSLRHAVELAHQSSDALAQATAHTQLAAVLDDRGAVRQALAESKAGRRAAKAAGDEALYFRAVSTMAYIQMRMGQPQAARQLLEPLMDAPILKRQPSLAARAARQIGIISMVALQYERGLEWLREGVRRALHTGDLATLLICQTSLFFELSRFGLYSESRPLGYTALELAERLSARTQLASLLMMLAHVERNLHQLDEAFAAARRGAQIAAELGSPEYQIGAAGQLAETTLELGMLGQAQAAVELGESYMAKLKPLTVHTYDVSARVWLALKQPARARAAAHAAVEQTGEPGIFEMERAAVWWNAAQVLADTAGVAVAQPIREQAYAYWLDHLACLGAPALRRALIASTPATRALSAYSSAGARRLVLLPAAQAPTGRVLRADELNPVLWTLHAPTDPPLTSPRGRRVRLMRLSEQARAQGAYATVKALAEILAVAERTVLRDVEALRRAGTAVETRATVRKQGRTH